MCQKSADLLNGQAHETRSRIINPKTIRGGTPMTTNGRDKAGVQPPLETIANQDQSSHIPYMQETLASSQAAPRNGRQVSSPQGSLQPTARVPIYTKRNNRYSANAKTDAKAALKASPRYGQPWQRQAGYRVHKIRPQSSRVI